MQERSGWKTKPIVCSALCPSPLRYHRGTAGRSSTHPSPATVEAPWQRLQWLRKLFPKADDPLFRTRALVKVRVPLPGRVRLTDNPNATHITLSRAVPPLDMLKHTGPYQQEFLESAAEFQRHIFSSAKAKKVSDVIDASAPVPNVDPPLTAFEQSAGDSRRESDIAPIVAYMKKAL